MILVRWILGLVLTLAIALTLAIVFLPVWFNPNDYRQDIELQIGQATGRKITLDGDLQFSVFPWLGVRTHAVTISQPTAIGGDFVRIATVQLRLQLLPLLSKRVELDTVLLDGAQIHFIKVSDALNSLSVEPHEAARAQANSKRLDPSNVPSEPAASGDGFAVAEVALQGVKVRNATLLYEDRSDASRGTQLTQVSEFNGTLGRLVAGEYAAFSLQGGLVRNASNSATDASTPAAFAADGQVMLAPARDSLLLRAVTASFHDPEQQIDGEIAHIKLADFDQLELHDIQLRLSTSVLEQPLDIIVPSLNYHLDKDELKASAATLEIGDSRAQLTEVSVAKVSASPNYSFKLNVPSHSLAQTLAALKIDYQPTHANALQRVALSAEVSGTDDRVSLTRGIADLDSTKMTFAAHAQHFDDPVFDLTLDLDVINLDDYLPLPENDRSAAAGQSLAASLVVPMAAFEGFMADALLNAQSVTSGGVQLTDVAVKVKSDKSKVVITPYANLYDGKLLGDIAYGQERGVPTLRINNEIDLVSLGELLTSADITDQLTGLGSLVVDLIITERNGKQFNEGTIKLFAKNGALKGVDVKQVLDTTYAQYQSLRRNLKDADPVTVPANASAPTKPQAQNQITQGPTSSTGFEALPAQAVEGVGEAQDETGFAELLGTFNVKDFRITNTDFILKAPLFRISGAGEIDLASEQLDYTVSIAIVNSTAGQGGEALEKLKGITLPVRFSGALMAPRFSVDTKMLYRSLLKQEIDDKKAEYLQEKLGIEGAENLSTKETLKQALLEKLLAPERNQEREQSQGTLERPMQERAPESSPTSQSTESGQAQMPASDNSLPATEPPFDKDALKQELGKKLLDEIFK